MKIIKLLLLSLIVLSCSKDDEANSLAATEYGVYVKNSAEFNYRFYNFHTGETYHEGITKGGVMFPVTSKEKSNSHVIGHISSTNGDLIEVFGISKNGSFYYNDKDNPNATNIKELNHSFVFDDGSHEVAIPVDERYVESWIDSKKYSNN